MLNSRDPIVLHERREDAFSDRALERLRRLSGNGDDFGCRIDRPDVFDDFNAVHVGHDEIGNHKIGLGPLIVGELDLTIRRENPVVAQLLRENRVDDEAGIGRVIDHKNYGRGLNSSPKR